jgi:hypothetical protein
MDNQAFKTYGILGASLSAQSIRHDTGEFVGYVEYLRHEHAEQIGTKKELIKSYTYPGNRLSDGGIVKLSEILQEKPDICVLELLIEDGTRGRWATPPEIQWIYSRLIEQKILPFTFMVALPFGRKIDEIPVTKTIREICQKYELPIFEAKIDEIIASGAEFNGVHTLTHSGRLLAEQLANALKDINLNQMKKKIQSLNIPTADIYLEKIEAPCCSELHRLSLTIAPKKLIPYQLRLIQRQEIGQHSPVIYSKICAQEQFEIERQEISIWDPYCHYTRLSFVTLVRDSVLLTGPVRIEIEISQTDPQYQRCRRSVNSWPSFESRFLKPKGALFLVSNQSVNCSLMNYE